MLEFTGILTQITPAQNIGNNGAQKRFIIVHEDGAYPKDVAFDLYGRNIGLVDNIPVGTRVRVCFDVKSREYNGKWYNDLSAYRVEPATAPQPQQTYAAPPQQAPQSAPVVTQQQPVYPQQPPAAATAQSENLPF